MDRLPIASALLASLLLVACNSPPPAASQIVAADLLAPAARDTDPPPEADLLAHGEYMTRIAGCNDCHTPGFAEAGGDLPKTQWLMGSPVGWHGPWGTTYAVNLRLKLQDMDEAAWIDYSSKLHTRPPMPDFAVRTMNERDCLAIYRFIRSLGPGGKPAPAYLPPGEQPTAPYVDFVVPPAPAEAHASS